MLEALGRFDKINPIPVVRGDPRTNGEDIRIEDDVLIQEKDPEILSSFALKEISDLEF